MNMAEGKRERKQERKRRGRGEGSIYQRGDGLWTATVSLGYDGNGKRRRRTVYGESKKEVQDKLRKLQNQAANGQVVAPGKLKVGEYLDRWLEDYVRVNRSPNTYRSYEGVVRCHVKEHVGGVRLADLTPAHVQGLYSAMERGGASPRLRQLTHAVLRKALAQALKEDLVIRNACVAVDRPRVPKTEMVTFTPEQTRQFLATAAPHRLSALFVLAAATGMREGELFALAWSDIDLEGGALSVQQTLEEIDGKHRLKEPKSAKGRRRIDLPAFAVKALWEHKARMMQEGHLDGPVFCDRRGGWLRKSNFTRQIFKPMIARTNARLTEEAEKAGTAPDLLPDIRFHDMRHGHATLMLELGEHPKVVQERLGHSQISLTLDTYSHVLPAVHKKAAEAIDKAFRDLGT
jgi:integrase